MKKATTGKKKTSAKAPAKTAAKKTAAKGVKKVGKPVSKKTIAASSCCRGGAMSIR